MIPRFKPWLGKTEFRALFRSHPGAVHRFEKEFAKEFGAVDAVAFPYGRSALWAFLKAVGLKDAGVVMPAYTCSVVAHAVTLSGNRANFVDIQAIDYNMDLDLLSQAISEQTRAVVATHLFGYPLDLDRVEAIVAEAEIRFGHKIWLIQDCAHSFGASWKGRLVGTSGDVGLYAFNISKTMTAIFGGILTFQNQQLADTVRAWRDNHFRQAGAFKSLSRRLYLLAVYVAFNEWLYGLTWWIQEKTPLLNKLTKSYHLDNKIHFPPDYLDKMLDVEAAIGLEQLKKYPEIIARRRKFAKWYDENLPRREGWVLPKIVDGATYSHYVVRVPSRSKAVEAFANEDVHVGELIQYNMSELSAYCASGVTSPVAGQASMTTINLPLNACLSEGELGRIADVCNNLNI